MAQDPTLSIENLTFRYRDREAPAIADIDFQLDSGELLLVAGASGCGKTTLIRAINGLVPRSYKGEVAGRIRVCGQDIAGQTLAEVSQRVGTLLQDPERQILGTKVLNEVAFGLENLNLPRAEIRSGAEAALERLGISHLSDRETHFLSGGEKQKVALAGVLAMEPRLLLLDEPLASLDPASAQEALRTVRQLADAGMSVLLVEHRVEDVLAISPDRVLYMDDGRVQYLGGPDGLAAKVSHHQVKLPASMVMQQAADEPAPQPFEPAVQPRGDHKGPLIEFDNVTFGYERGPEVLHDINLSIGAGEIVAILGPNGAGKTTLIKHAIGLLKPRDGSVRIGGRDTGQLTIAEIASTLGYVFQSPSHMLFAPTVGEELSFGPRNLGHETDQINEEVAYALNVMNLAGMREDPPLALSFGQQKRVSIGAVLAMRSRVLVMDEPTAGQDYRNYMAFMDSILTTPGFEAVLFITHDIDLAVVYANRVLLMADGDFVADGPPQEVLRDTDRLRACNLVPTSLLQANLDRLEWTGEFRRAEALAHLEMP
ncbi:MAG: ABC transporter ATP-binding protein [Anaerolineales bacterium]